MKLNDKRFWILMLLVGLVLLFTTLSFVSSLDNLKPAKINEEYTILQTCADATYINISVSNINGLIISEGIMIKNGSVWTYKITPDTLGRYDVGYESDGCENSGASYFEVTPNGEEMNGWKITIQIFASLSTLFLMILFLFLSGQGIKSGMAKSEQGASRFFFMGLSLIFLLAHILITNSIIHDTLGTTSSMASSYTNVMYIFFVIIIFAFLYTLIKVVMWEVDIFFKKKGLR